MTANDLQMIKEALSAAQEYIANDVEAIDDEEYLTIALHTLEMVNQALELIS